MPSENKPLDGGRGSASEPSRRSEPPRRKSRLVLRLVLIALLGFAAAAAAGYLWWTQRADHQAAVEELEAKRLLASQCQTARSELDQKVDALTRSEAVCKSEQEGFAERQRQVEDMMTRMEANMQATREELEDLRTKRAETEKRLAAFKELTSRLQKMIDAGELDVEVRNGTMLVSLPAEVLFPSGKADLSDAGKLAVLQVGASLKQFPERRFMVVGHTDNLPLKNSPLGDNWQLSTARAVNVTQFLINAGLDPKRLMAAGHGPHDPVASNKTKEGREKNRRIEIVLMPDIDELPAVPELKSGATDKPAEE